MTMEETSFFDKNADKMDRFVDIEIVEWWDSTEVAGW